MTEAWALGSFVALLMWAWTVRGEPLCLFVLWGAFLAFLFSWIAVAGFLLDAAMARRL